MNDTIFIAGDGTPAADGVVKYVYAGPTDVTDEVVVKPVVEARVSRGRQEWVPLAPGRWLRTFINEQARIDLPPLDVGASGYRGDLSGVQEPEPGAAYQHVGDGIYEEILES